MRLSIFLISLIVVLLMLILGCWEWRLVVFLVVRSRLVVVVSLGLMCGRFICVGLLILLII